jgi:hypothetical protein
MPRADGQPRALRADETEHRPERDTRDRALRRAAHEACELVGDQGFPIPAGLTTTELDAWLASVPLVSGDVWQSAEVTPCRVSPTLARSR